MVKSSGALGSSLTDKCSKRGSNSSLLQSSPGQPVDLWLLGPFTWQGNSMFNLISAVAMLCAVKGREPLDKEAETKLKIRVSLQSSSSSLDYPKSTRPHE